MANPPMPATLQEHIDLIKSANRQISLIAVSSKKEKRIIDPTEPKQTGRYAKLDQLLQFLESEDFQIKPEIKQGAFVPRVLQVVFADPEFQFPPQYKTKAEALFNKFEEENWGAPTDIAAVDSDVEGEDDDGSASSEPPARRRKATVSSTGPYVILQPPRDHTIWGTNGIMHGIALKRFTQNGRLRKVLNPVYRTKQRSAKFYGHNNLSVGSWFAAFLPALFHGAHGSSQAGICGDVDNGAYSVVVSGMYGDLDRDDGSTIYYSGSGSHDNTDPNHPGEPTRHTRALHASQTSQRPVRVLRTSRGVSEWSPVEGVRYDGLYKVISTDQPLNGKGGRYERFKLERLPGQLTLDECKKRPTPLELRAYNKIVDGYDGYRLSAQ